MKPVTAVAHPNIAFIKYWGNRDDALRIPVNGSISMNLDSLTTRTTVQIIDSLSADEIMLNGQPVNPVSAARITSFLSLVRAMAASDRFTRIDTSNNFPSGSGIASSASGFAALAVAASAAYGLHLAENELSRLARRGSGSASRSIPAGFVEWLPGTSDSDSCAYSLAQPDHWDLADVIAVIDSSHKATGSTEGHHLAPTSPLQAARVQDTPRRLAICREAILRRDFQNFAAIVEHDTLLMHSVMMTSNPSLMYWQPATLQVIRLATSLRHKGLPVCFSIDAGPNVHLITPAEHVTDLKQELERLPGVLSFLTARAGGAAHLVED